MLDLNAGLCSPYYMSSFLRMLRRQRAYLPLRAEAAETVAVAGVGEILFTGSASTDNTSTNFGLDPDERNHLIFLFILPSFNPTCPFLNTSSCSLIRSMIDTIRKVGDHRLNRHLALSHLMLERSSTR